MAEGSSIGERREAEESCLALDGLDGPAADEDEEAEAGVVVAMGEDVEVAGAFPFRAAGILEGVGLFVRLVGGGGAKALQRGGRGGSEGEEED